MNTLKAEKRTLAVKAKKLRREGYVTGNVFGKEMKESIPVKMDAAAVDRLLKTSNKGSQIMLDIDGESHNVLIKEVESGVLQQQLEEVSYKALPSALVDKVEIDVAELHIGDTIKVKDLSLAQDKDVHLVTDPETTVVTVTESHIAIADDEDSEETE